jgi:hypothetical protein
MRVCPGKPLSPNSKRDERTVKVVALDSASLRDCDWQYQCGMPRLEQPAPALP